MILIYYPDENYNTWISEYDADDFFETRLNADQQDAANKEAALITAFNSINELDLTIYPTESDQLTALKNAQCEEVLHELINNAEAGAVSTLSLQGLLSVKIPESKTSPPRYSERALAILRLYIRARPVTRNRFSRNVQNIKIADPAAIRSSNFWQRIIYLYMKKLSQRKTGRRSRFYLPDQGKSPKQDLNKNIPESPSENPWKYLALKMIRHSPVFNLN